MSAFLIVTGPPGAGKSSVARLLADTTPRSALVAGDAFFGFLANGAIEPWLPESHEQNTIVTHAAGLAAGEFARGGLEVVYDGVIGPWFLEIFGVIAGLSELDYVVLLPSVEICQQRVAGRAGHGFTDLDATADVHRQFTRADVAERHVIRNDSDSPEAIAASIREAQIRGELRYVLS
jgi:cytidylate kinase